MSPQPVEADSRRSPKGSSRARVIGRRLALAVLLLALLAFVVNEIRSRVYVRGVLRDIAGWVSDFQYHPRVLGDGGSALDLRLFNPMGILEGPSGDIYVSDRGPVRGPAPGGGVIWRIDEEGRAHLVAGSGLMGFAEPGAPAKGSDLAAPEGLAFDGEGRLHFVDTRSNRIFRIELDGTLTVVAGTGERGFEGDGGPADLALLSNPTDVKIDAAGNVYIADVYNQVVRRVGPDGVIQTIAGTGTAGYSGEGGHARDAMLHDPWGLAIDPSTQYLIIGDAENNRVRQVDGDGLISTIVGSGELGYSGDGGPALDARIDSPQSFAFDSEGRMYFGDEHNHAIRMVDLDGTIHTIAGTGSPGRAPEGAVASEAPLDDPETIHISDGILYITDGMNSRVIQVTPDGLVRRFAGREP